MIVQKECTPCLPSREEERSLLSSIRGLCRRQVLHLTKAVKQICDETLENRRAGSPARFLLDQVCLGGFLVAFWS